MKIPRDIHAADLASQPIINIRKTASTATHPVEPTCDTA